MDNLAKRLFDSGKVAEAGAMEIVKLQTLLINLADAADAVGVKYFDTDTFDDEVGAMQEATLAARAALK